MKRVLCAVCLGVVLGLGAQVRGADDSVDAAAVTKEQQISKQRMMQIYEAIQAYRKDHKELPDYLSDLYPQYIADTNTFLCPTSVREGKALPFAELLDPKLLVHFGYEFSAHPIEAMFGYTGPMTMASWKRMQMMVVGGGVPILRCFAYDKVLNVGFDGKFYESPLQWEELYTDKVNARDLEPRYLRLTMLQKLGGAASGDALAFEQLQDAASRNNRGVVVSDRPLSESDLKWNQGVMQTSLAVAEQARKFITDFPKSASVPQAAELERNMLLRATAAGSDEAGQRLQAQLADKLKSTDLTEEKRFELRAMQVQVSQAKLNGVPPGEKSAALQRQARTLIQEFPKRLEPYLMLLASVRDADEAKVRPVVEELRNSADAPAEAKERAEALLTRLNLVGHPPQIQFTALDGRDVDTAKLKGKVVLVDFWATWCGPCVGEIPHVKEAYEKLHDKGFEIIGISFDSDKAALEKFVKSKELPWPQYFDGKGWANKFGVRFGIQSIPAMWLIDRKGNVVDTNARDDLAGRVQRLLAQKPDVPLTEN